MQNGRFKYSAEFWQNYRLGCMGIVRSLAGEVDHASCEFNNLRKNMSCFHSRLVSHEDPKGRINVKNFS